MDRLTQLQTKKTELLELAGEKIDAAEALAESEEEERDGLFAEATQLQAQAKKLQGRIDVLREQLDLERSAPARSSQVTVEQEGWERDPMLGFESAADFGRSVRLAYMPGSSVDPRLARVARAAKQLGIDASDEGGMSGPRAAPSGYHAETHTDDGYMVPPKMEADVYRISFEEDPVMRLFAPEPTESNVIEYIRDETTPWGSTGIQAVWTPEAAQLTVSSLVTDPSTYRLHKLAVYVQATEEIVADAPRLNQRLTQGSGEAIAYEAGDAFINGAVAGKPLGCIATTYNGKVSQAKETSQTAATIVVNNLSKMFARVLQGGAGDRIVWFANRDTFAELVNLTLGDKPVFLTSPQGVRGVPPDAFIYGKPLYFIEQCATLGTVNDIFLANLAGYSASVKRGGVKFASSIHLFFDYDVQAFRWTVRLGGQPRLSAAVSPAKGSTTRSHFVTLATRA